MKIRRTNKHTKYQLMIVYSKQTISAINRTLLKIARSHGISQTSAFSHGHCMRITHPVNMVNRITGEEKTVYKTEVTDKTFYLMSPQMIAAIHSSNNNVHSSAQLKISRYSLNDKRDVLPSNCRALNVTIPKNMSVESATEGITQVMNELVRFGVLADETYRIAFPGHRRDIDTHKGRAVVIFDDDVDDEAIVISRVYMHQTFWNFTPLVSDRAGQKVENDIMIVNFAWPLVKSTKTKPKKKYNKKYHSSNDDATGSEISIDSDDDDEIGLPSALKSLVLPSDGETDVNVNAAMLALGLQPKAVSVGSAESTEPTEQKLDEQAVTVTEDVSSDAAVL